MLNIFKHVENHIRVRSHFRTNKLSRFMHIDANINHALSGLVSDGSSSEWCEIAYPKLIKLTRLLKGLDLISGRLVNVEEKRVVNDEFLVESMRKFKLTGAAFLKYRSIQQVLSKGGVQSVCVDKPVYDEPFALNSLKRVCDVLGLSAQHRKLVRLAVCPQVTQHQIWTGALAEILNQLKYEMNVKENGCMTKGDTMAQQVVVNCLKFLDDVVSYGPESGSWMQVAPKKGANSPPSAKWADLLEMFDDLINCLKYDQEFLVYVIKLDIMKEGLAQIKDVLVDKNIGYKEVRHQQSLVQKKLTKFLGHSSRCLFTLLLYYLYGSIQDIELDICCWLSEDDGGNKYCLCVGKILTSDGDKMVRRAVKQLDRALGVIKFVHEMAEMKEILELQGHIWCLGSESRSLSYRGHNFFVHGISL
ncbi:hypothetical protein CTI12_AA269220 [Artemisia annua]|uniref:Uncharacterized protein n=1 Tax=Artemisia annua TaxID=35608 RepID=A0A2U1NGF7_ARTAN|nr:hypothetical protein CTI12_AA269220 [Artemisia annua]